MYREQLSLAGRAIVVAGAGGGGHGTASCAAIAEAGGDVVAIDLDLRALDEVAQRVRAQGRRCLPLVVDVTRKVEVDEAFAAAEREFGALHGLVNVVGGMGELCDLMELPESLFDRVMDLNLRSALLTCQAAARGMLRHGVKGSIVNVTSVSAEPSAPSHGPYGAAKAALNSLGRTMALEWSAHGIRVNGVAPGIMRVPRHARAEGGAQTYEEALRGAVPSAQVPLGVAGNASHVAAAVLFLLSDLSAYVTGEVINVDGGLNTKSVLTGDAVRSMLPPR